jgi:predicted transposase YbfD/YdcC
MKVEDKSNEIIAFPALLKLLFLTGCIITIDAMGTQTEIAKKIIERKADYVLALKAVSLRQWMIIWTVFLVAFMMQLALASVTSYVMSSSIEGWDDF